MWKKVNEVWPSEWHALRIACRSHLGVDFGNFQYAQCGIANKNSSLNAVTLQLLEIRALYGIQNWSNAEGTWYSKFFLFAKIKIKQGLPVVFCCSLRCRIAVYVVVQSWIGFLMYGFISRWKIVCLKENMTTALSKYLQMKSCQVGFSRRINCTIWKRSPCITFSRKKTEKICSKFLAYKSLNGYSILFPWSNFFPIVFVLLSNIMSF